MKSIAIWTSLLLASAVHAADTITIGKVYPIAEPDLRTEIKDRASNVNWEAWTKRNNPSQYSAFTAAKLPRAKENWSFLFDPTYTLPRDIIDGQGKVLYPAGTTINVLERLNMTARTIVVGPNQADMQWLEEVAKPLPGDKVLLANGNVLQFSEEQRRRFFRLDERLIERFGLRAIPAIVEQEGTNLRVSEYAIPLD